MCFPRLCGSFTSWDCFHWTFLVTVAERKVTVAERKVSAAPFGLVVLHQGRGNLAGTVGYLAFPLDLILSFFRSGTVV